MRYLTLCLIFLGISTEIFASFTDSEDTPLGYDTLKNKASRHHENKSKLTFDDHRRMSKNELDNLGGASFSFAGGGYLPLIYNLGVCKWLQEKGPEHGINLKGAAFTGDSAGAIISLGAALNVPVNYIIDETILSFCEEILSKPDVNKKDILAKHLYSMIKCYGNGKFKNRNKEITEIKNHPIFISVVRCYWENKNIKIPLLSFKVPWLSFKSELVGAWENNQDLVESVVASAYVPWVMGDTFSIPWRDGYYIDGGFLNHCPRLNQNTCRIYPSLWHNFLFWWKNGVFSPPTKEDIARIVKIGYSDAEKHADYFTEKFKDFDDPQHDPYDLYVKLNVLMTVIPLFGHWGWEAVKKRTSKIFSWLG